MDGLAAYKEWMTAYVRLLTDWIDGIFGDGACNKLLGPKTSLSAVISLCDEIGEAAVQQGNAVGLQIRNTRRTAPTQEGGRKEMNILLDGGLPEEIGGYPIYPDFRNMIQFERALADEKLPDAAKRSTPGFSSCSRRSCRILTTLFKSCSGSTAAGRKKQKLKNAGARPRCMRRGPMISTRMRR